MGKMYRYDGTTPWGGLGRKEMVGSGLGARGRRGRRLGGVMWKFPTANQYGRSAPLGFGSSRDYFPGGR